MIDRPRVALIGHVTEDVFESGIKPGGCVTYASCVLHRLGCQVELHTSCAPDWTHPIADEHLEVHRLESSVTTRFRNDFRSDGTRSQTLIQRAEPLQTIDAREFDWLHIVPVLDEVDLDAWMPRLVRARATSTRVSVGLQGFTRHAAKPLPSTVGHLCIDRRAQWLDSIDMIFASEEDLQGQPELLDELVARVPTVMLTLGERGARVWQHREQTCEVGVFETLATDPTGAGDTFAAAVVGSLANGRSLESALRCGAAFASLVIESTGISGILRDAGDAELHARERLIEVV